MNEGFSLSAFEELTEFIESFRRQIFSFNIIKIDKNFLSSLVPNNQHYRFHLSCIVHKIKLQKYSHLLLWMKLIKIS
jgi:hypothetical protein